TLCDLLTDHLLDVELRELDPFGDQPLARVDHALHRVARRRLATAPMRDGPLGIYRRVSHRWAVGFHRAPPGSKRHATRHTCVASVVHRQPREHSTFARAERCSSDALHVFFAGGKVHGLHARARRWTTSGALRAVAAGALLAMHPATGRCT